MSLKVLLFCVDIFGGWGWEWGGGGGGGGGGSPYIRVHTAIEIYTFLFCNIIGLGMANIYRYTVELHFYPDTGYPDRIGPSG